MSILQRIRGVPAQYTTDPSVFPTRSQLAAVAKIAGSKSEVARNFAAASAVARGMEPGEDPEYRIIAEIHERKAMLEPEHARMRDLFRRLDNLYFPEVITTPGGPDHWPPDKKNNGRVHISLNNPPVYVDIPAALQAVQPIENYIPASGDDEDRESASRAERLYFQWKEEVEFELAGHKACVIKGLYGHTFAKVYWDAIGKVPAVTVLESPENLYVGWGDSDFRRMDWTIYCYGLSPQSASELYDVDIEVVAVDEGRFEPYVSRTTHDDPIGTSSVSRVANEPQGGRLRSAYEDMQVEVYDYWYRKAGKPGKRPEVWNAIYVGNALVEHKKHTEYDDLPYIILPNTFIPGYPYGRPELYDLEQLFREKDERLSEAGQMIHSAVGGQMWQIVGTDAPDDVPANAIPRPNKVAAPGAGNELKTIQPFLPAFPVEEYLKRLDHEIEGVSGINELLLGRAPLTALGSSKAITALIANYSSRISMKRDLYYQWRKRIWRMGAKMWERKSRDINSIIDGQYVISVQAPDLTPRDALENAQKVINLVNAKLYSMERAMDEVGVEDPETEKDIIRTEQTDPALNPAAVQAQASLAAAFQQLGVQPPGGAPPAPNQEQTANTARQMNPTPAGGQSLNGPENAGNPPPSVLPANAQPGGSGGKAVVQTMTQDGESSGRLLTQTPLPGGGQ